MNIANLRIDNIYYAIESLRREAGRASWNAQGISQRDHARGLKRIADDAAREYSALSAAMPRLRDLSAAADREYDRYVTRDREPEVDGCSCHISAPCSFCMRESDQIAGPDSQGSRCVVGRFVGGTGMIILDRLHRGDRPQMVAVTAAQTKDRLVFTDEAGADAFIEAHRRADPASSFSKFEVPEISLLEFWRACRDLDWHYDASEDQRVWREGGASASRIAVQATISYAHRRMYIDWRRHIFSGPAYGTEKHPAPDEPIAERAKGGAE